MCGSSEPHPYPVRIFTCHMEQARADEVQRVIVYIIAQCNAQKTEGRQVDAQNVSVLTCSLTALS
jgi:hypothetical protein